MEWPDRSRKAFICKGPENWPDNYCLVLVGIFVKLGFLGAKVQSKESHVVILGLLFSHIDE